MEHSSTNTTPFFNGNVIPNWWYQKFTNGRGAPDLSLISVLSEIVYWYRPKKITDSASGQTPCTSKFAGDLWQTSYEHFQEKFSFSKETIRKIFVKLETAKIITRELRTVTLGGQKYNNRLFIHLNQEFLTQGDTTLPCAQENPPSRVEETPPDLEGESGDFSQDSSPDLEEESPHVSPVASPHFEGHHIYRYKDYKKEYIKNRYRLRLARESFFCKNHSPESESESDFLKNSSSLNLGACDTDSFSQNPTSGFSPIGSHTNKIITELAKKQNLKDFHPLTEQDCLELQRLSGREFSSETINGILLEVSGKTENRTFKNKKAFMAYMAKVLASEKRYMAEHSSGSSAEIEQEEYQPELQENVWGRIREALIFQYGGSGKLYDRCWFARLIDTIDEESRVIALRAPNSFVQGWIRDNYLQSMEKLAAEAGYTVELTLGNQEGRAI